MTHTYYPQGICATEIRFDIVDGIVVNLKFSDGCEGNLAAVSRLVTGMRVTDVIDKLAGLPCEGKDTSCPDQLSRALAEWKAGN
jgi:uncharacterized protein (TIGR03905 family)